MATEKLKFKLELFATMWDKPPHAAVSINGKEYFSGQVTTDESNPTVVEFEHNAEDGKKYDLVIKRSAKDKDQCVVDKAGEIIKDQLLHIKGISIDEIDIGALIYEGVYTPEYPEPWATQQRQTGNDLPENFKNVTKMGHNGTWTFTFTSPFYMWLLENLY